MKADAVARLDVGQSGVSVQEQDQLRALAELEADGAACGGLPGLLEEVGREEGAKRR
jgi:hypothetical protein